MSTDDDLLERLQRAREELERARERVNEIGESRLRTLEEAYEGALRLLGKYEERATGSGDFAGYIEFQKEIAEFVDGVPEDLPEREAFESVDDRMQKRRLSEHDFETARETLERAGALAGRLDERREAEDRLRSVRQAVRDRIYERRQEIARLETVRSLGQADLDAPTEELREPIDAYNESVMEAFDDFSRDAPAREVLAFVRTTQRYPLVEFEPAPEGLTDFLERHSAGREPLSVLREYTEFSRSKLQHYVDEPATFQRLVGGNRTYLDRLDGEPLTIEWPPPPPGELRWRTEELIAMVNRFAPESTVAALQSVRGLARDESRYERLRQTARATVELTESERELIAEGAVETELEAAREQVSSLESALDRDRSG